MTVYLVILEDRHVDVQIEVYADKQAALRRAAEIVAKYGYKDDDPFLPAGWLFNAILSREDDRVCVRATDLKQ